jgi:ubiquinone/menaquinone biosynthesis C-methylase UbiE
MSVSPPRDQEEVNAYFQARSSFWRDIYSSEGVFAEIIRDRQSAILAWSESLALLPGSRVLEVGCGAGFMAVALAQCGFRVQAIDTVEAMVELARQHAVERGANRDLSVDIGDVYALTFADDSFDLVIAAGVLPWLERVDLAIKEMARVTKPGGYIILTTANPLGLPYLLDPLAIPVLRPLKERVKSVLERAVYRQCLPGMAFHGNHFMSKALASVGLMKTNEITLGFEFSLFRHKVLPEPLATALYHRLQRLADRNMLGFDSLGMSYHVLARKSAPPHTFGDKREEEVN